MKCIRVRYCQAKKVLSCRPFTVLLIFRGLVLLRSLPTSVFAVVRLRVDSQWLFPLPQEVNRCAFLVSAPYLGQKLGRPQYRASDTYALLHSFPPRNPRGRRWLI
jgi:hypothetical protein